MSRPFASSAISFVRALFFLSLFAGTSHAAPSAKIEYAGETLTGNRKWSLLIDPDETLYTGGSPLAVEIAVDVLSPPVSATSINSAIWDVANPGRNPFTGTVTEGLWSSSNGGETKLFASFGSIFLTASSPVELLSFETAAGTWATKLSWGKAASGEAVRGTLISQLVGEGAKSFPGQTGVVGLPGDATFNGIIDGADYTRWADHFQLTGQSWDHGDFTQDGIVDGADYTVWADHFAPFGLQASATPEPSTLALASIGALALLAHGQWRRRK